ncbi:tail fiber protein [Aliifodinibius sp. S!AR15-10]|uniref:phage tail protein n=1 Tax=Aliifodinibius sp. S!AR15-10 TaxID=2950437 RepID=UPI00285DEEC3|nr:tail fiber protein [Aliifodinibius sp. S!AR15-10]MDR8392042.1 tail fiber protein [Aliifodinibius sp. S!AR15-10]
MEHFIAEIILFAGNFAPRGWKFCHGQILPISSNTALFSLLGAKFGGDGRTTFALPDLRGRVVVGAGRGPGLRPINDGEKGGQEETNLNVAHLPSHNHGATANANLSLMATIEEGNTAVPDGNYLARGLFQKDRTTSYPIYPYSDGNGDTTLNGNSIAGNIEVQTSNTGNNDPIPNRQPYQGLNYIIAVTGIFPPRS